ncbi:MAG: glycosyltransferase family 4 protein, partial [Planctomycetota bacterium]
HETTLRGGGRLVEKKGCDDMIRAVAKLRAEGRTLRCVLVGDGEERAHLESLSDELGAGVEFVGACTQDEARAHMGRATLMVLPCIIGDDGNRDALPTVLLEAMASGLPSVSTPVVGVGEILGDEEGGLLVPQRDPDAVAAAVATLLDDPTRRERLAVDGRARAERLFAVERNVAVLRSAFEAGAPRHGDAR